MIIPSRRAFAMATLVSLVTLFATRWPPALWVSLTLLAVLAALTVEDARRAAAGALTVRREVPDAFSVGRTLPIVYEWTSGGAASQSVRVSEQWPELLDASGSERQLELPPGTTREALAIMPQARGTGSGSPLTLRRRGPLGLGWWQQRAGHPWQATVYPSLAAVAHRGMTARARHRLAGLRRQRSRGDGRLFETLREWVPGDDTRTIDWKATARRGRPIARVYEDERRQQVVILLDAGRLLTAEVDGVSRLDAAVDAALQLAYDAIAYDDDIGLLAFADDIQAWIPPTRGRRGLRAVLRALASVEGRVVESDYPRAFRHLAVHNRRRALSVVFTDVIDRTASAALLSQSASLRPRHLPLVVLLRDPAIERLAMRPVASPRDAFERAAAEALLEEREAAISAMRRQGIVALDVAPEAAGRAVVEGYERLKRRGAL